MSRVPVIDDGGHLDRLVEKARQEAGYDESAAMKLVEKSIVTALMLRVTEEARRKRDSLAAFVPKKPRGSHRHIEAKKPHSSSVDQVSRSMDETKKTVGRNGGFESCSSTEDQQKKKNLLKRPNMDVGPQDIPSEWRAKIETKGGSDVKLVITKQMYATDVSTHQGRLSIPVKQVRSSNFLTEDEMRTLNMPQQKIPVTLMEPCGHESKMWLKKWNLNNSSSYALLSSWNKVLERNLSDIENGVIREFKQNDIIQLWSFRINGELCMALFKVKDGDGASLDSTVVDQEQD